MADPTANETPPVHDLSPPGVPFLAPHLVCDGAAAAIDFYAKAFGAQEMMRLPGPDGRLVHASVMINGAMPDADAVVARAVQAGATVVMPVADQFWGDRYGVIADPFGHHWSVATPGKDAPRTSEALQEAMRQGAPEQA